MNLQVQTLRSGCFNVDVGSDTKVCELRRKVAALLNLEANCVKLIAHGRTLEDAESTSGLDTLLAVGMPAPLDPALRRMTENEAGPSDNDDEDVNFKLPATASKQTRKFARYLKQELHVPDMLLIILFQVKPKIWLSVLCWLALCPVAARFGIGPLYVLGTIFVLVFVNLGNRKQGESSAYTVYNGFRALPGQLTADELDRQVRTGQM